MARTHALRRLAVISLVSASVLVTAGCTPPQPEPSPSPTVAATVQAPSATPTPTPTGPALVPEGSASDNLPYFTQIVQAVWATPDQVRGRAYVDALVAGGFDKAAMQVTADESTVGNPAESIQFSVRWGNECLVGQVGPATGNPVTTVLPGLDDGTCLIGTTRPIDW